MTEVLCECLVVLGSGGEAPKLPGYKVKTAVYRTSATGSLLGSVLFFVICTKEEGYPLKTSKDDRCFFSEITDGWSQDVWPNLRSDRLGVQTLHNAAFY